jgi:hypothetical protein
MLVRFVRTDLLAHFAVVLIMFLCADKLFAQPAVEFPPALTPAFDAAELKLQESCEY